MLRFARQNVHTILVPLATLLIGVLVTTYFYHKGRVAPPYRLTLTYTKIPLATPALASSSGIRLYAELPQWAEETRGTKSRLLTPVSNLVALKITIRNEGPQPIRKEDYDVPLELRAAERARIVASSLGSTSRPDLKPVLTAVGAAAVRVEPVVLEPRDAYSLDIIVADDPKPTDEVAPVLVQGHVVGVTDYRLMDAAASERRPARSAVRLLYMGVMGSLVGLGFVVIVLELTGLGVRSGQARYERAARRAVDDSVDVLATYGLAGRARSSSRSAGSLAGLASRHPNARVRIAAVESLGYLIAAHYVRDRVARQVKSALIERLRSDGDPAVRAAAAVALRQLHLGRKPPELQQSATEDPDERVRWVAGLGLSHPPEADTA